MGQLQRGTIVSEGLLIAGDSSLTTRANVWLNAGLRQLYKSWPWPFLHKRHTAVALSAGTTSFTFGNGSTETLEVARIFDPISVYKSDFTSQRLARVKQLLDVAVSTDEAVHDSAVGRGQPSEFRISPSNTVWGTWTLRPYPVPDVAYLMALNIIIQPADISSDASVPVYPNDETLIQIVVAAAAKYLAGADADALARAQIEEARLRELATQDRMLFGSAPGVNDSWPMDGGAFK